MYIKQIIIQGFKSYRERVVVEPFDKKLNLVLGCNGSGKSNFFFAIQFVLSSEFAALRPKQREALLHAGTGSRVLSAFVEVIFDNTDGRIPISTVHDACDVHLRRTISGKNDQYTINGKQSTRLQVSNLLESAGLSSTNPYYIVKQGEINNLATASDSTRLNLLRDIAGARFYNENRDAALEVLQKIKYKMNTIQNTFESLQDKFKDLETERKQMKKFEKWDKERRAIEYFILENELLIYQQKLEELKDERKQKGSDQSKCMRKLQIASDAVNSHARLMKNTEKEFATKKEKFNVLNLKHQRLLLEKTKLDLTIKDLLEEISNDSKSKTEAENELKLLQKNITEIETKLKSLKPKFDSEKAKEDEYNRILLLKEQKRKELYSKQGRANQFKTKDERDRWIQNELKSLQKYIKEKSNYIGELKDDINMGSKKHDEIKSKIKRRTSELNQHRTFVDQNRKFCTDLNIEINKLQANATDLYRQENDLKRNLISLKEDLRKVNQDLYKIVGKSILNGIKSVQTVLDTFVNCGEGYAEIPKNYYGLFIDNFKYPNQIDVAVEVTAGNRLFHHIVQTDEVGSNILKEMNRQNLSGEVTFMPLNRLYCKPQDYPTHNQNVFPIIIKLEYDARFDTAVRFVFGKTLICRNLEIATTFARTSGFDCVTLEGDRVASKGVMNGGYFNLSRSRIHNHNTQKELLSKIAQTELELNNLSQALQENESNIISAISELQKAETKGIQAQKILDIFVSEINLMREEMINIETSTDFKKHSLEKCNAYLEELNATKKSLELELNEDLLKDLSETDKALLEKFNTDIKNLTRENKIIKNTRMKLEAEKNRLEQILTNNLIKRREELQQILDRSIEAKKYELSINQLRVAEIEKQINLLNQDCEAMEKNLNEIVVKLNKEKSEFEEFKAKERAIQDELAESTVNLEKFAAKQQILEHKISECADKIKEFETLPVTETLEKYQQMKNRLLFAELDKVKEHLKNLTSINNKSMIKYTIVSKKLPQFKNRIDELTKAIARVEELFSNLDARKLEAVDFTFKQLSKNFTEVFKKLVPNGQANLIMRTRTNIEGDGISPEDMTIDNFTGVSIRASFNGTDGEMRQMKQLSGGQKSLVALSLIFAIQKCDPAPFYLFDEIDQALDAEHRQAVAKMIYELSADAQFIVISFRSDLLQYAHKIYGVKFRNQLSHIEYVSLEAAREFIEDNLPEI